MNWENGAGFCKRRVINENPRKKPSNIPTIVHCEHKLNSATAAIDRTEVGDTCSIARRTTSRALSD